SHPECAANGDLAEPTSQRLAIPDCAGVKEQIQESRLERLFGVLPLLEDLPADPHDHRTVPRHQHLERGLGLAGRPSHELLDQLPVGMVSIWVQRLDAIQNEAGWALKPLTTPRTKGWARPRRSTAKPRAAIADAQPYT